MRLNLLMVRTNERPSEFRTTWDVPSMSYNHRVQYPECPKDSWDCHIQFGPPSNSFPPGMNFSETFGPPLRILFLPRPWPACACEFRQLPAGHSTKAENLTQCMSEVYKKCCYLLTGYRVAAMPEHWIYEVQRKDKR